jgi:hypothetical protein
LRHKFYIMASQIVRDKSISIPSNLKTGKENKGSVTSIYFPDTYYLMGISYSENWCVQHQFSLNKFSLNKFSLNKFSLNKFSLNKFSLNKFSLNKFSLNKFIANQISIQ